MRLFPALISASSSELSPVGDIMLKDFVPADKQMEQKSETRYKERWNRGKEKQRVRERETLKKRE